VDGYLSANGCGDENIYASDIRDKSHPPYFCAAKSLLPAPPLKKD
jgi:hypothetical protein